MVWLAPSGASSTRSSGIRGRRQVTSSSLSGVWHLAGSERTNPARFIEQLADRLSNRGRVIAVARFGVHRERHADDGGEVVDEVGRFGHERFHIFRVSFAVLDRKSVA